jgi:four helix bundle protein
MDHPSLIRIPKNASVRNQLDRASTSVPLNIAEGNGKFTSPDRCRFFDNARGSALESAACLDVMIAKRFVCAGEIQAGKAMLVKIVSMLFGLIRANSDVRVFEEPANYRVEKEQKGRSRSKNRIGIRIRDRVDAAPTCSRCSRGHRPRQNSNDTCSDKRGLFSALIILFALALSKWPDMKAA